MMNKRILQVVYLFLVVLFIPMIAQADAGPKPSLKVYVKNYDTKEYYLDLLTKVNSSDSVKYLGRFDEYKQLPFYQYNKDGWMPTLLRERFLSGKLEGDYDSKINLMVHQFGYRDVPNHFKVIVQKLDGTIIVSNEIKTNQFFASVILDMKTGELKKIPHVSLGITYFLKLIVLTIAIELFIALLFRFKRYLTVIYVNLLTQILLHISLVILFHFLNYTLWFVLFLLLELGVIAIEYLLYKIDSKEYTNAFLLKYTIVANVVTWIVGLLL